jgi:hypothetical protein
MGPALAMQLLLITGFFGLIVLSLVYAIRNRHSLKKSIPAGLLFLGLATAGIYVYTGIRRREDEASKKFLGDYKLGMLDRQQCESCKVRLKSNYRYDILVNGKVVGGGKWHIETAIDIPGYFLKLENGPRSVTWEADRLIDYIDRTREQ